MGRASPDFYWFSLFAPFFPFHGRRCERRIVCCWWIEFIPQTTTEKMCWAASLHVGLVSGHEKYSLVTRNNCFQIKRLTSRRTQYWNPTSAGAIHELDSSNRFGQKKKKYEKPQYQKKISRKHIDWPRISKLHRLCCFLISDFNYVFHPNAEGT